MELDELRTYLAAARRAIDARPPPVEKYSVERFDTEECPRCGWNIPTISMEQHLKTCRYECGLCGDRYQEVSSYRAHMSYCAAHYDQHRRKTDDRQN